MPETRGGAPEAPHLGGVAESRCWAFSAKAHGSIATTTIENDPCLTPTVRFPNPPKLLRLQGCGQRTRKAGAGMRCAPLILPMSCSKRWGQKVLMRRWRQAHNCLPSKHLRLSINLRGSWSATFWVGSKSYGSTMRFPRHRSSLRYRLAKAKLARSKCFRQRCQRTPQMQAPFNGRKVAHIRSHGVVA